MHAPAEAEAKGPTGCDLPERFCEVIVLMIALVLPILAIRVSIIAIRVSIIAIRVSTIAIRVSIIAIRVLIIAIRVSNTAVRDLPERFCEVPVLVHIGALARCLDLLLGCSDGH
jgi:hypothetical protein